MNNTSGYTDSKKKAKARQTAKGLRRVRARTWMVVHERLSQINPEKRWFEVYGHPVWRDIFYCVFDYWPQGFTDPKWDTLFSPTGLRALNAASQWCRQQKNYE